MPRNFNHKLQKFGVQINKTCLRLQESCSIQYFIFNRPSTNRWSVLPSWHVREGGCRLKRGENWRIFVWRWLLHIRYLTSFVCRSLHCTQIATWFIGNALRTRRYSHSNGNMWAYHIVQLVHINILQADNSQLLNITFSCSKYLSAYTFSVRG